MKKYIKRHLEPLLIGFSAGLTFAMIFNIIADIIVRIALIFAP